jgi:DNA-binding transcriptional MerR regulator
MLTIGQLAAYAGVTVRAVRHYHQIGLLPEPERDASGYRTYGAAAVVLLIKIRTLADAGVPLRQIARMLDADDDAFAEAVERIGADLDNEIQRLETSRKQIAQLAAGDNLVLSPEVVAYLDRLRGIGVSGRMLAGERDAWILIAARWPDKVQEWIPDKLAQLSDPRVVRLYRVLSALMDAEEAQESLLVEAADIMVGLAELAEAAGELDFAEPAQDDAVFALVDDLANVSDDRADRLRALMRARGWDGWTRMRRI